LAIHAALYQGLEGLPEVHQLAFPAKRVLDGADQHEQQI